MWVGPPSLLEALNGRWNIVANIFRSSVTVSAEGNGDCLVRDGVYVVVVCGSATLWGWRVPWATVKSSLRTRAFERLFYEECLKPSSELLWLKNVQRKWNSIECHEMSRRGKIAQFQRAAWEQYQNSEVKRVITIFLVFELCRPVNFRMNHGQKTALIAPPIKSSFSVAGFRPTLFYSSSTRCRPTLRS